VGHVVGNGDMRNAYKILVGKYKAKAPLGRMRGRWEDNIKICISKEYYMRGVDWTHLTSNRGQWLALVKTVMNLLVPQQA